MALTRPVTHPSLYKVLATDWNEFVNNWIELYDKNQGIDFVPIWSSSGTQPVLVNGTVAGKYGRVGKFVWYTMRWTAGSSTTFGTGRWEFLLPVTSDGTAFTASAILVDSGTQIYTATGILISTTEFSITFTGDTSSGGITNTTPFTWANGDSITCSGFYLASAN
jgi:hypothetical protein